MKKLIALVTLLVSLNAFSAGYSDSIKCKTSDGEATVTVYMTMKDYMAFGFCRDLAEDKSIERKDLLIDLRDVSLNQYSLFTGATLNSDCKTGQVEIKLKSNQDFGGFNVGKKEVTLSKENRSSEWLLTIRSESDVLGDMNIKETMTCTVH